MNAIRAPSTPGNSSSQQRRARLASAVFALTSLAVTVDVAAQEPIAAVWKERSVSFTYSSLTTVYACEAMAGRVSSILRALGARDDIKVTVGACSHASTPADVQVNADPHIPGASRTTWVPEPDSFRPSSADQRHLAIVRILLMMPTEATEEVLAELQKDKSRRELVARVTANPAARFDDPVLFHAQRQLVTLSHDTIGIETSECDLLHQMSTDIFPQLGVRVVDRGVSCSADSRVAPKLVVEALVASPFEAPAPPPIGTEVPGPGAPATSDDAPAAPRSDKAPE
jgi:hypothetical protein